MSTYYRGTFTILGGTIDNTPIGGSTPSSATFTTSVSNTYSHSNVFDSRTTNTQLEIGPTVAGTGGVKIGSASINTEVAGVLTATGNTKSNELDTITGTTLKLAKATATKVEIAQSGVITEVKGTLDVFNIIDTIGATTLQIAPTNATSVEIGAADADTTILGKTIVKQGVAGANVGIDTTSAGVLAIGGETATSIEIGASDTDTKTLGQLQVKQGAAGANIGIDTISAGVLSVGGQTATSLNLGASDADTTILGKTIVKQGVAGSNVGIDTASAGILAVGGETATSLELGASDADTKTLGQLQVKQGAAGANIGIDTISAGILAIGGQTATSVTVGASDADTTILGKTIVKQGAAGANVGIDTAAGGILAIGGETATSVTVGASDADTTILGKTIVKQGAAGANVGIDTAGADVLAVGGETATSIELGASDADTKVLGQLQVKQGAAGANIGVDTISAGILAVGGQTATSVTIGATDADTSILGGLLVRAGTAAANTGIDTASAGVLALGGDTATKVEIADTGIITEVQGNLNVLQQLNVTGNASVTGNLTVLGTTTTVSSANLAIADRAILLSDGYISDPARSACIVAIIDPDPTTASEAVAATGFIAGSGGTGPTVCVASTAGFAAGQLIHITGANNADNNGLYEVNALLTTPTRVEFRGTGGTALSTGIADFAQFQFVDDTTVAGSLTLVSVGVFRFNTSGGLDFAYGSTNTSFATFSPVPYTSNTTTDNAIARYDGTAGNLQNSTVTVADTTGVINFTSSSGNIQVAGVDVFPTSVTANQVPKFSSTTGRALINSGVSIDGSNNVSGVVDLTATGTLTGSSHYLLGSNTSYNRLNGNTDVNILTKNIVLNAEYNTDTAVTGGFVVVYDPTTTQNDVSTGGFATTSTVVTDNANTFATGDLIQIINANNLANNGLYEVASYSTGTITISTSPTLTFTKSGFTVDTTVAGTITKVNVSHMRAGTDGNFEVAKGSTTGAFSYTDLSAGLTGSGTADRLTKWSSTTAITDSNITIDSNSNLDMHTNGARHIIKRSEAYSLSSSGAQSPSANVDISFVTVTDSSTCTGTLANGTFTGEEHIVIFAANGSNGIYDLTVTNYQPANGGAPGSKILRFDTQGQGAHLIFNGSRWYNINGGVQVV